LFPNTRIGLNPFGVNIIGIDCAEKYHVGNVLDQLKMFVSKKNINGDVKLYFSLSVKVFDVNVV
jgi:hypothetical protein